MPRIPAFSLTLWVLLLSGFFGCATAPDVTRSDGEVTAEALEGEWLRTMPGGHELDIAIHAVADDQVIIATGRNLGGRYRIQGDRLVIVEPSDKRMASLTWHIKNLNEIILIDAPSAASVGSDYTGATLTR